MATNTDEIKKLKKELNDMKKMLLQATEKLSKESNNDKTLNNDRDILFTSLYPGILNVSTQGNGEGEIYTFNIFGEEQNIPYQDARQIIRKNRKFATQGYFFVNDDDLVETERLSSDYKKILNKDELLKSFESDRDKFKDIFEKMTDAQKEILHQIVVKKVADKEDIDLNIIKTINDGLRCDILSEVQNDETLKKE